MTLGKREFEGIQWLTGWKSGTWDHQIICPYNLRHLDSCYTAANTAIVLDTLPVCASP